MHDGFQSLGIADLLGGVQSLLVLQALQYSCSHRQQALRLLTISSRVGAVQLHVTLLRLKLLLALAGGEDLVGPGILQPLLPCLCQSLHMQSMTLRQQLSSLSDMLFKYTASIDMKEVFRGFFVGIAHTPTIQELILRQLYLVEVGRSDGIMEYA